MKYDFSGWATKNDLLCSDGRTIRKDAFKDCDGSTVPLVWNHQHTDPNNVLGHALLENRENGVYAFCSFNDTDNGRNAKQMVEHGDIVALSIYANRLKQKGNDVLHGMIREVSLVLAGANPGAYIDSVVLEHSDGSAEEEGIIYTDEPIELAHTMTGDGPAPEPVQEEKKPTPRKKETKKETKPVIKEEVEEVLDEELEHADEEGEGNGKTLKEIWDTLNEEQKKAVYFMLGKAKDDKSDDESDGGKEMSHNVFDGTAEENEVLSHAEIAEIFEYAQKHGSLKEAVLAHGITELQHDDGAYGITNIDYLFPEFQGVNKTPDLIKREDSWVSDVMSSVHHTPFSRIKSTAANITAPEARAKGYVKGNKKVEEVIVALKRTTEPQTIYKKQKLDRDDIIDITDFDVVAFLKAEMRGMLNEELARAYLVGDGRDVLSEDKIKTDRIRPIWGDSDVYTINKVVTGVTSTSTDDQKAKAFIRACRKARKDYKGSGNPALYTTEDVLTDCLLLEDQVGRVIYDTEEKLRTALRVSKIVTVPVMEGLTRVEDGNTYNLWGIIVNLADYNVGADKGGAVNMFEDFDIDYNQEKYLIETRCSGALTKPYSAITIEMPSFGVTIGVDGEDPTTNMLGKLASELQSGIVVNDDYIQGTLKYVTGYTGYSGTAALQQGNFLALKFSPEDDAVTTVELLGGHSGPVTLDSDNNCVLRIENKLTQKLKVVSTVDGVSVTKVFSLTSLNCQSAG